MSELLATRIVQPVDVIFVVNGSALPYFGDSVDELSVNITLGATIKAFGKTNLCSVIVLAGHDKAATRPFCISAFVR
ncbi:hypothetical protein F220043C3_41040 [Enterocloster asparagiformis]